MESDLQIRIDELASAIEDSVHIEGPLSLHVNVPSSLENAAEGAVTFCTKIGQAAIALVERTSATAIVCKPAIVDAIRRTNVKALLVTANPRLAFIQICNRFFLPVARKGIHATAVVSSSADIGDDVYIGPYCVIEDSKIGKGTAIHSGVHIHDGVTIGRNVTIKSGSVIGGDGFGFERKSTGESVRFPHFGKVIIHDDVEIGANTCIDRGALDATIIGRGAKIDNLVHIAHNVRIGDGAYVIAHAMVAGGTVIGARTWIAPCACLRDGISIGSDSLVGLGAVVIADVPDNSKATGAIAMTQKMRARG